MLRDFVEIICRKSPLQKSRLEAFLEARDGVFWERADRFAEQLARYLASTGRDVEDGADAYLRLCANMLKEQTKFMRTGVYSCVSQSQAYDAVYSSESEMRAYMIGLALSQFLWESHYGIYSFFLDTMQARAGRAPRYLEIGPGHGLWLAAALNALGARQYDVIDISAVSLDLCRGILPFLTPHHREPAMRLGNAESLTLDGGYDFVTMGEVIEHLDDPRPLLRKIGRLLAPGGVAFLTTCANCPAIDHVYLFHSVQEIQDLLRECGLHIGSEGVFPAEKLPWPELLRLKVTINYAALVRAER